MDKDAIDYEVIKKELNQGKYEFIGSGSSRRVFDLDNGYVVKIAINNGGLAQNRKEYNVYNQEHTAYFAPILDISEDAMFIIMKKAERLWSIQEVLEYYQAYSMRELVDNSYFITIRETYGLSAGDLVRRSSWGLIDDIPVLIDYGYTGSRRCQRRI